MTRSRGAFGALVLAAALLAALAQPATSAAAGPSRPATSRGTPPPVTDLCTTTNPHKPSSTGTQTPAVTVQMQGVTLASASTSAMLASAYSQFNDMLCTRYQHDYHEAPPDYYYYDCVGFTGYTLKYAYPQAWQTAVAAIGFKPGQATATPLEFASFFDSLTTHPLPYWTADPTVSSIRPGDMIAWQPTAAGGIGHSVLPLVAPRAVPGTGNLEWEVVVEDSTQDPHGPDDTRLPTNPLSQRNALAPGQNGVNVPSGLGIGTLILDTTPAGIVNGVRWSVGVAPFSVTFGAAHPGGTPGPPGPGPSPTPPQGYDLVGADGGLFSYGDAVPVGSLATRALDAPVVGAATNVDGQGAWMAGADGGVFTLGDAPYDGSMGGKALNAPVVGITASGDGTGYLLAGADGGVFPFGTAQFHGSLAGTPLDAPVVGIVATPNGDGYWLVAADGGVFAFGDASYYGSEGGKVLNRPIVGMAATPSGKGYWLVAADGGVFAFGDASYYGSEGGKVLNRPIVGMAATPSGAGYWLAAADGGVFTFGDATYAGSAAGVPLNAPVTAITEA